MSIYDSVSKITKVDRNFEHNMTFSKNTVVGEFTTHSDKRVKLFFSEYNMYKLKDLSKNYKSFKVKYQFWDPDFCKIENLYDEDIDFLYKHITNNLNIEKKVLVSGFLRGFTKLYECIKYSYDSSAFAEYTKDIGLDKHTICYLMTKLSLNIKSMDYTDNMMDLINRCINDGNLISFLISNDFNMDSKNFKRLIVGTRLVDEISGFLMIRHKNSLDRILSHMDLIKGCEEIVSPLMVLDNGRSSIFYNMLNIKVDYDIHESLYTELIELYREKGGAFDIKILRKTNTIRSNLVFITEYYKSSLS